MDPMQLHRTLGAPCTLCRAGAGSIKLCFNYYIRGEKIPQLHRGHESVFGNVSIRKIGIAIICLNVSPPDSYLDILMLNMMVLGGGGLGR